MQERTIMNTGGGCAARAVVYDDGPDVASVATWRTAHPRRSRRTVWFRTVEQARAWIAECDDVIASRALRAALDAHAAAGGAA